MTLILWTGVKANLSFSTLISSQTLLVWRGNPHWLDEKQLSLVCTSETDFRGIVAQSRALTTRRWPFKSPLSYCGFNMSFSFFLMFWTCGQTAIVSFRLIRIYLFLYSDMCLKAACVAQTAELFGEMMYGYSEEYYLFYLSRDFWLSTVYIATRSFTITRKSLQTTFPADTRTFMEHMAGT